MPYLLARLIIIIIFIYTIISFIQKDFIVYLIDNHTKLTPKEAAIKIIIQKAKNHQIHKF